MSDALAILTAHFAAQRRRRLHVPGLELELYAAPMTLADHAALAEWAGREDQFCSRLVQRKALTAAGNPAFPLESLAVLRQAVSGDVLRALANAILDGGPGPAKLGECLPAPSAPPCEPSTATPPPPASAPPTSLTA